MATRAGATATPFKGESFPAYVLPRSTPRRPLATSDSVTVSVTPTSLNNGPSTGDLTKPTESLPSPTPDAISDARLARFSKVQRSTAKTPKKTGVGPTFQRPSLSEQLKTISQGAQSITAQLRSSYHLTASNDNATQRLQRQSSGSAWISSGYDSIEATTVGLSVGRLDCRFPCPVLFTSDRCSYLFQHPFDRKEIQMIMYYRDMRQVQLSLHDRSLRFRVDRPLEQFGDDYRPCNPQHYLTLVFATQSEARRVKQFLSKHRGEFLASGSD